MSFRELATLLWVRLWMIPFDLIALWRGKGKS